MLKLFGLSRMTLPLGISSVRKKRGRAFNMTAALQQYHQMKDVPQDTLDAAVSRAIEAGRNRVMCLEEREAQLVSFVWGNAPEGNQGTRESVRKNLSLPLSA